MDRNENEKKNRSSLLEEPHEIFYSDPWPWKKVVGKDNAWVNIEYESWWTSDSPGCFIKNADGTFISRRCQILSALKEREFLSDSSFIYYSPDGKRCLAETTQELDRDWNWASIFQAKNSCAIELSIDRQCQHFEIGIARLTIGDADGLDDTTTERLVNLDRTIWQFPKDDQYWHIVHRGEVSSEMTDEEIVEALFAKLHDLQQVV